MYCRVFAKANDATPYIYGTLDVLGEIENTRIAKAHSVEDIRMKVGEIVQDGSTPAMFKIADDAEYLIMAYNTNIIFQDPEL